jgi:hypothetical protein
LPEPRKPLRRVTGRRLSLAPIGPGILGIAVGRRCGGG